MHFSKYFCLQIFTVGLFVLFVTPTIAQEFSDSKFLTNPLEQVNMSAIEEMSDRYLLQDFLSLKNNYVVVFYDVERLKRNSYWFAYAKTTKTLVKIYDLDLKFLSEFEFEYDEDNSAHIYAYSNDSENTISFNYKHLNEDGNSIEYKTISYDIQGSKGKSEGIYSLSKDDVSTFSMTSLSSYDETKDAYAVFDYYKPYTVKGGWSDGESKIKVLTIDKQSGKVSSQEYKIPIKRKYIQNIHVVIDSAFGSKVVVATSSKAVTIVDKKYDDIKLYTGLLAKDSDQVVDFKSVYESDEHFISINTISAADDDISISGTYTINGRIAGLFDEMTLSSGIPSTSFLLESADLSEIDAGNYVKKNGQSLFKGSVRLRSITGNENGKLFLFERALARSTKTVRDMENNRGARPAQITDYSTYDIFAVEINDNQAALRDLKTREYNFSFEVGHNIISSNFTNGKSYWVKNENLKFPRLSKKGKVLGGSSTKLASTISTLNNNGEEINQPFYYNEDLLIRPGSRVFAQDGKSIVFLATQERLYEVKKFQLVKYSLD